MATATATQRRDVKEYTFVWEGFDRNNRQVRGETRAASETVVTTNLRRQGIRVTRSSGRSFRGGRTSQREGRHVLHAPARHDAARRRAAAAGLRHRRPRPQQRALLAADAGHQEPHRIRLEPVAGVPRAPGPVRHPLLQPGERRRDLRHARRDPRPARDVQGKDPRDQEQDQVGAVLPDLGHRRRDRRRLGHHDLGDPGVQAGVHELRRGPARRRR